MNKNILLAVLMVLFASTVFAVNLDIDSVSYEPAPAIPGDYITLWVHLKNNSRNVSENTVFNLDLSQDSSDANFPFYLEPGDESLRELGNILPFQTALVKYRILVDPAALDGSYEVKLEAGEDGRIDFSNEFTIEVSSRKPEIVILSSSPISAPIGKTNNLQLVIKNVGSGKAVNLEIGISKERTVTSTGVVVERNIIPLGTAFSNVPELSAGETATLQLPFVINPDSESKAYFIPIEIKFQDENKNEFSQDEFVGLKVSDEPELGVVISDTIPLPFPGGSTEITIDLYNNGVGRAKFLVAKIDSDFFEMRQNEYFIGSLESDDFDSLTLEGKIKSDAQPGDHMLKLSLVYKNDFGDEKVFEKDLPVKIYSAEEISAQGEQGNPLFLVIIILVIAGVGFF